MSNCRRKATLAIKQPSIRLFRRSILKFQKSWKPGWKKSNSWKKISSKLSNNLTRKRKFNPQLVITWVFWVRKRKPTSGMMKIWKWWQTFSKNGLLRQIKMKKMSLENQNSNSKKTSKNQNKCSRRCKILHRTQLSARLTGSIRKPSNYSTMRRRDMSKLACWLPNKNKKCKTFKMRSKKLTKFMQPPLPKLPILRKTLKSNWQPISKQNVTK